MGCMTRAPVAGQCSNENIIELESLASVVMKISSWAAWLELPSLASVVVVVQALGCALE